MVRVLHAGDFHLDSAFGALTPDQARQRRTESRESVQRLVDWANDHDIQLMLLAGDLFDGAAIGGDTARLLAEALGSFQGRWSSPRQPRSLHRPQCLRPHAVA